MQKNTKFRYLQSSQIPVMFYYTNRECHLYERQESLEVEKLNFLNFPIPAITERIHDREARIRKDMRAPLSASVCHSFTSWMTLGKSIHPSGCSYVKLGVALRNSMIPSSLKVHHLLCFFFFLPKDKILAMLWPCYRLSHPTSGKINIRGRLSLFLLFEGIPVIHCNLDFLNHW